MINSYTYPDHLETPRLATRFLVKEDIEPWARFFDDKDALEFFPPLPFPSNKETAQWWIEKQLARYRDQQFGLQGLIHKRTGAFVGQCGLLTQEVEVAYHVFKEYWGQGFAPEAARAFIDFAFQNRVTGSVISIIDVRNTKAQRVAEKNGLLREKQTNWSEYEVYIYRISSDEWR